MPFPGNPGGRPLKKIEPIDVISVIDQPIVAKIGGKMQEMHPFEASIRQLVKKSLKERKVRDLIELLKQFEAHGLFKQPELYRGGGVLFAPKGVTVHEWINSYEGNKGIDADKK